MSSPVPSASETDSGESKGLASDASSRSGHGSGGVSPAATTRLAGSRKSFWDRIKRSVSRRPAPRTEQTMLPVLIQVFAGFTKLDGRVAEAELDSILGFLRYDYPETVYSELRQLFADALRQPQDLDKIGRDLSARLPLEEKVLLGVQLYVLISRAGLPKENLITFYQFMTTLGVASEAINIVYQLNTSELGDAGMVMDEEAQPLETISIARRKPADVVMEPLSDGHSLAAFRFQDLILVKNIGTQPIIARGRQIDEGEFCRVYEGQQILISELVLDYQDLVFYFNAKKNVSGVQLFLAQDSNGAQFIEKARSKQSYLEVKFGLNITAKVLREVGASIGSARLRRGENMEVSIRDKIVFDDLTEISFSDLRRRARELGGRFNLEPNRSEYLVSNNPNRLREGDILLSPGAGGEILLRIKCDYFEKSGELEVIDSSQTISVGGVPVRNRATLRDDETIKIGDGQYLRCFFSDRIIEEERNVINVLHVDDISHSYDRRLAALENISFTVQRGEMVCIMGPSGCGKSTLLKALGGQLKPDQGKIDLNGVSLYENQRDLTPFIAFIPQEDAFDPLLTVEENIDTATAIRAPHFSRAERRRRADAKLVELGLNEIRHRLAGDDRAKNLSGGQQKRLNAGMDMIGISDVYLFDEPTSGLSSKDSEHVLEIIRGLTHNKITLVSIHQPSSRLFHMFDKAILLDNGGKLAFCGTPAQMLEYFSEAYEQEGAGISPGRPSRRSDADGTGSAAPAEKAAPPPVDRVLTPDFIFDVLETPLRDLSGDVIYEEDFRGQLIPARRFSPAFWGDRFQTYRLLEEVNLREIDADATGGSVALEKSPRRPRRSLREDWVQFANQFKRAFWSKLRNRANLATTLLEAPALAVLVAVVLRYSEDGAYNFASAFHIPSYLFLTLVIALFLGLTNSAEEIIRDHTLLQRERNHGIRVVSYVMSKILSLGLFALVQCVIYLLIADAILSIREMFWANLFWMFLTSMVGVAAGLFISSVVNSPKTALNVIPLIMIPNIILGGALIKYEEMNRGLDIIHSISNWIRGEEADDAEASKLKVPALCELMPLRWSYEAIIIAHAEHNPVDSLINEIDGQLETFKTKTQQGIELTDAEVARLESAKQALAVVYGLEGASPGDVAGKISAIREGLRNGNFDPEPYYAETGDSERVTAEQLYRNTKVRDLFDRAEVERQDYRKIDNPPNVFFGSQKRWVITDGKSEGGGPASAKRWRDPADNPDATIITIDTLWMNATVMLLFTFLGLGALHLSLRYQLRKV